LYPHYVALAEGGLSEAEFASWLRVHIRLDDDKRVNEAAASYGR
jgi:death-on-curing protein